MTRGVVYRQCKFRRLGENFIHEQVAWIPEKAAKQGKTVSFKLGKGKWDEGWEVVEVYPQSWIDPTDPRDRIKSLRKATGDSLPRRE
ncbi:MAG: hypothetical protein ACFCD0_15505 [Gemmataceae bacterium]